MTKTNKVNDLISVKHIDNCTPSDIPQWVLSSTEPLILKGLVANWPVVIAAKQSPEHAVAYLNSFYQGMPINAGIGKSNGKERLFYNDDFSGFNFTVTPFQLDSFLAQLVSSIDDEHAPSMYVGSTHIDKLLPLFRQNNDLSALNEAKQLNPLTSIWLGNQSRIAAHHDVPSNIACCIAGQRRFTLFPPEQLENLYIGPLDHTPAGQAVSLVDFHQPDFERFPKFKQALSHALVAELEPGDALFLPSMWWHQVEGLSAFNLLINYWWQTTETYMGAPIDALYHALLNIKNLPDEQKKAWQAMFNYYIFNKDDKALSHIPEEHQGILKSDNEVTARKIRAMLLNKLNR